jgi:hypothetical protein
MSAKNGDKSRYQINRKRAVLRRSKIRELLQAVTPAAPAERAPVSKKAAGKSTGTRAAKRASAPAPAKP